METYSYEEDSGNWGPGNYAEPRLLDTGVAHMIFGNTNMANSGLIFLQHSLWELSNVDQAQLRDTFTMIYMPQYMISSLVSSITMTLGMGNQRDKDRGKGYLVFYLVRGSCFGLCCFITDPTIK